MERRETAGSAGGLPEEGLPVRSLAIAVAGAALFYSPVALAEEERPEPTRTERRTGVEPIVGASLGRWMGVPITRVVVGIEFMHQPRRWESGALDFHATLAPGRTENGLGAHRGELGFGLSTAPAIVRVGGGVHLSYAMLERTTVNDPFWKAVFGNIGGFGVGAHALLEGAFRIAGSVHGTFGLRGSADVYDGGVGYEGGPFVGARF